MAKSKVQELLIATGKLNRIEEAYEKLKEKYIDLEIKEGKTRRQGRVKAEKLMEDMDKMEKDVEEANIVAITNKGKMERQREVIATLKQFNEELQVTAKKTDSDMEEIKRAGQSLSDKLLYDIAQLKEIKEAQYYKIDKQSSKLKIANRRIVNLKKEVRRLNKRWCFPKIISKFLK